ncbi:hypothetical protein [Sinomonas sp. ASV322]|uniref:putative acetyltransferase n=1 Tax=Sinomonas sp. ASV322 TaxID=3041920 RepID=UPI0035A333EB
MPRPADLLRSLPPGTRVVVRHRIEGGFTDSLGELSQVSDTEVTIATRRGLDVVRLDSVVAAKPVPPPPAPRARRAE